MSPVDRLNYEMLGIKPVRKRPVLCDAVRITKENIHDLAQWIRTECSSYYAAVVYSHEIKDGDEIIRVPRIYIKCDRGETRTGEVGDYLIRGTLKEFYSISYEAYANNYEDVTNEEC